MFNGCCTVFNRVYDKTSRLDKWVGTQINDVFWGDCKAANIIKAGLENADSAMIYIPFDCQKQYKKAKAFEESPEGYFTLRPGDLIVKGLVDFEGTDTQIKAKFDDVVTITSVDTMDYGSPDMQHWEVGAK